MISKELIDETTKLAVELAGLEHTDANYPHIQAIKARRLEIAKMWWNSLSDEAQEWFGRRWSSMSDVPDYVKA